MSQGLRQVPGLRTGRRRGGVSWSRSTTQCDRPHPRGGDPLPNPNPNPNPKPKPKPKPNPPLPSGEVIHSDSLTDSKKGVDARSIYSLAVDEDMRVVATGSPDKVIRFWDSRSGRVEFELKGHTENIRALQLNLDATICISGSSDGSLRLWDVRQRSCFRQAKYHSDSIWAIAAERDLSCIVTGGRDGSVYRFDAKRGDSVQVVADAGPVSALALSSHESVNGHVWLSANPKRTGVVNMYRLSQAETAPGDARPDSTIPVGPGIVRCQTLNDRQHVLSEDSEGMVWEWHVGTAKRVKDHGEANFKKIIP